jgi:hypothetical protein
MLLRLIYTVPQLLGRVSGYLVRKHRQANGIFRHKLIHVCRERVRPSERPMLHSHEYKQEKHRNPKVVKREGYSQPDEIGFGDLLYCFYQSTKVPKFRTRCRSPKDVDRTKDRDIKSRTQSQWKQSDIVRLL